MFERRRVFVERRRQYAGTCVQGEEQCTSCRCWVFVFLEKNEPLQQCQRHQGCYITKCLSVDVGAMFG